MPRIFQLIDLDRTLFDTSGFVKALTDEINLQEPGYGTELDERYEAAYAKEETFFLMRELRRDRGDTWFEALVARVVQKHGADTFALPGMRERLAYAETLGPAPAWGICTYGDDVDQRMKQRIIGLADMPMHRTATADKGVIIKSWQQADGTFKLPEAYGGGIVDVLTLEDDKLRAFGGFPKGALGFWITTRDDAEAALAALPKEGKVVPVRNLSEIVATLKANHQQ